MATTLTLKQDVWIGGVKQLSGASVTVDESLAASLIAENKAIAPTGWNNYPQSTLKPITDETGKVIGIDDGAGGQIGLAATYTWATKPAVATFTGVAFISDVAGGSYWYSNGVNYLPVNNAQLSLYQNNTGWLVPSLAAAGATYSQSGTTITVDNGAIHNLSGVFTNSGAEYIHNGKQVYLTKSTGALVSGWFTNFTRTGANTFTCQSAISQTIASSNLAQTTGEIILPITVTIPAGSMNANGQLLINEEYSYNLAAGNKTISRKINGTSLADSVRTTTGGHDSLTYRIKNRNSAAFNSLYILSESSIAGSFGQYKFTANSDSDITITYGLTVPDANNFVSLDSLSVDLRSKV